MTQVVCRIAWEFWYKPRPFRKVSRTVLKTKIKQISRFTQRRHTHTSDSIRRNTFYGIPNHILWNSQSIYARWSKNLIANGSWLSLRCLAESHDITMTMGDLRNFATFYQQHWFDGLNIKAFNNLSPPSGDSQLISGKRQERSSTDRKEKPT